MTNVNDGWRDPTVVAIEQRKADERNYLEQWGLYRMADNAPAIPDPDPYRVACRNRLQQMVANHNPLDDYEAQAAHRQYQERRRNAQTQMRLLQLVGEPVPDDIRQLAETPSRQEAVDQFLALRTQDQAAALRETTHPVRGEDDGSLLPSYQGDPTGWAIAAEQTKGRYPQIQHQRELAERGRGADLRVRRRAGR